MRISAPTSFSVGNLRVLTARHARNVTRYIGDDRHPRHAGLRTFGTYMVGATGPESFARRSETMFDSRRKLKNKREAPPIDSSRKRRSKTCLAWHLMAGLRPWLPLKEEQLVTLQNAVLKMIPPTGMVAWGVHAETLAGYDGIPRYYDVDFHFAIGASQDFWYPEHEDFRLDLRQVRSALDYALSEMLPDSNMLKHELGITPLPPLAESEVNTMVKMRRQQRRNYELSQVRPLQLSQIDMEQLLHYPRLKSALPANATEDRSFEREPHYLSWGDQGSYELGELNITPVEKAPEISLAAPRKELPYFEPPPKRAPQKGQEEFYWLAALYHPDTLHAILRKRKRAAQQAASLQTEKQAYNQPPPQSIELA